ncbi:MAG: cupin domain-containing protein [Thermoanaerobaculia bacterium]|nr:cupin domain-containing protein [Thermoanaerobaculia bacterium]
MTSSGPFEPVDIQRIDKPWGYELIWAETARYVGKILHVRKGESLSLQYHEKKEETLYLTRGLIRLTLRKDDEERVVDMKEGEAFHIPPYLIHRMEALEDSDIAEVSTTELDDVVRLEDRYGRS